MDNQTVELKVRTIVETNENGYSQVIINKDMFDLVTGFKPKLEYATVRAISGPARVFTIGGKQLFALRNKDESTTKFFMKAEDANACYQTLEMEREGEEVLSF